MLKIFVILLGFIWGCTVPEGLIFKRRKLEQYTDSYGLERYFLSGLPDWANRSSSGRCQRKVSTRLLNMKNLEASLDINYEEAHQFQLMLNVEFQKRKEKLQLGILSLQEEKKIFFQVSDRILAGDRIFQSPKYKRVHLIWIDPLLKNKFLLRRFKTLMNSALMKKGHPVLVSFCYSRSELERFREKERLKQGEIRLISRELFSSYSRAFKFLSYDFLEFHLLFRSDQKLHLFLPKKPKPEEFKGRFKLRFF